MRGPIRAKVGKGWFSTYARAMLMGRTFRFFASSFTRSRRLKLSSEYQQRTSSASSVLSGAARPGRKKPRAWLDQAKSGILFFVNHARDSASDAATQPA